MNVRLAMLFSGLLVVAISFAVTDSKSDEAAKAAPPAADSMLGKDPGQVRDDNGLKMKLVWCPPGKFMKGSPESEVDRSNREVQVEVIMTQGIWLGKHEVTQSAWKQVMTSEPWKDKNLTKEELDDFTKEGDDFPATYVSWEEATEFCHKLTDRERQAGRVPEGWEYTLPTDAQWEYTCRAGTETRFSFGDDESKLGEYAWFSANSGLDGPHCPHPVGQKKPNPWGLCDMHGNVWEWCRDWYVQGERPGGHDPEVTKRPGQYPCRVIRGGCFHRAKKGCRSAEYWGSKHDSRGSDLGFRVALSPSGNK